MGVHNPLSRVPERNYVSADWATYTLTLGATTWTRMNTGANPRPQIAVPVLGAPPAGTKWAMEVYGFMRLSVAQASTVWIGVQVNAGGMGSVQGGGMFPVAGSDNKQVWTRLTPPSNTDPFTIDFSIYSTVAQNVSVVSGTLPMARAYLVPA